MRTINFKREISGQFDSIIEKVTQALKEEGFGILTRIDFHSKIQEKLGKNIPSTVILGACNPQLAYEAYIQNSDVTSLLPCNVVVRDLGQNRVSVEVAKPSAMMEILGEQKLIDLSHAADKKLDQVLQKL